MDEIAQNETYSLPTELRAFFACMARYELKGKLGQGGMGAVFHAFDKQLQRDVAIKVQQNYQSDDSALNDRFIRETRALATLDHTNIVKILNSGISQNGIPFYVMELLSGQPLSAWLHNNTSPLSGDFFETLIEISSALEHIHSRNLVHRDLKTSNIMICDGEEKSQAKIIDFGIVRQATDTSDNAALTRTNTTIGSPSYMSPEQCRGAKADHLSDIYSFTCIMYEFLSGEPPLQGATAAETMYKHLNEPANKLKFSKKTKAAEQLAQLIASGLERDPQLRPQSAAELTEHLKEIYGQLGGEIQLKLASQTKAGTGRKKTFMLLVMPLLLLAAFLIFTANPNHLRQFHTAHDGTTASNKSDSPLKAGPAKAKDDEKSTANKVALDAAIAVLEKRLRRMRLAGQIHELEDYKDILGAHMAPPDDVRRLAALAVGEEIVADCKAKHKRDEQFAALLLLGELQAETNSKIESRISTLKEALSLFHDHSVEANCCLASLADLYLQINDLDNAEACARRLDIIVSRQIIAHDFWHPYGSSTEQRQNGLMGKIACLRKDYVGSLPYFARAEKIERDEEQYTQLGALIHDKCGLFWKMGKKKEAREALADFEKEVSKLPPENYDSLHFDIAFGLIKCTARELDDEALLKKATEDSEIITAKANRPKTDQQAFHKSLQVWR